MERAAHSIPPRTTVLATLGLLVLTLSAFAIVWPFNGSIWDDWSYLYFGQQGIWDSYGSNRDYVFGEAVLAHWLLPGRAQGVYILHIACLFAASLSIFHLLNRLNPGYSWFAFLTAAVYLVYIPYNFDQVRPLYIGVYSWTVALLMLAVVFFIEHFYRRGWVAWGVLLVGSLLGYVACRAYESTIPLLLVVPVLAVLAEQRLSRRVVVGASLWWGIIGIGVLQFVIPYWDNSPTAGYQDAITELASDPRSWLLGARVFYQNAFPPGQLFRVEYTYLAPALFATLASLITLVLLWRQVPDERDLPAVRHLGTAAAAGFVWIGLGGSIYIVSRLYTQPRAYFFAAPGQALVISSGLGLAALGLRHVFRIPARIALVGLAALFFMTAFHWYYRAESLYHQSNGLTSLTAKNILLRDVASLTPGLAEKTAVIYYCDKQTIYYQLWRPVDLLAGLYLYADSHSTLFMAGEIPAGSFHTVHADQQGMSVISSWAPFTPSQTYYRYDELVVLACQEGGGLRILDRFPPKLAPAGAALDTYNPYARIVPGFIPPERARMLAR